MIIKSLIYISCLFLLSLNTYSLDLSSERILVFAAHPDDEIIGCGGSIAKYAKAGKQVFIIYLTSGDAGSQKYDKKTLAKLREAEAKNGAKTLGIKEENLYFLHQPDGFLEENSEVLIKITELIKQIKPNIVYIPQAEEAHSDHKNTNKIALKAINKARGNWFQEAKGEPWNTSQILGYEIYPLMTEVQYCEDIKPYFDLKMKAIKQHFTQIESVGYDSLIEAINTYRTTMNGNGECFKILKTDKI